MEKAIDNLNKVIEQREKMIYKILSTYNHLTDSEYYKKEKQLMNSGYKTLKAKFDKLI